MKTISETAEALNKIAIEIRSLTIGNAEIDSRIMSICTDVNQLSSDLKAEVNKQLQEIIDLLNK